MEEEYKTLQEQWMLILGFVKGLLILVILAGNGVVMFSFNRYKFDLPMATKYFILSMSAADILLGVIYLPLEIALTTGGSRVLKLQGVCIVRQASGMGIYLAILLNHFALAVDRYIAILHPLRYYAILKRRNVVIVLLVIWLCSCFVTTVPMMADPWRDLPRTNATRSCGPYREIWPIVDKYGLLVFLILVVTIPVILYIRIFLVARKQQRVLAAVRQSSAVTSGNQRTAKLMTLLQFLFLAFWIPFIATIPLYFMDLNMNIKSIVIRTSLFIANCNSAVNPFIYSLLRKEFKLVFKNFLKNCAWKKTFNAAENVCVQESVSES